MLIVTKKISVAELQRMSESFSEGLVKAVVDVQQKIMAVDAELHSDLERLLIENGSCQENLWGINIYPDLEGEDFVEFDSMINIRPRQNNRCRGVEDESLRKAILRIVDTHVQK